jgi:hypothetical protein
MQLTSKARCRGIADSASSDSEAPGARRPRGSVFRSRFPLEGPPPASLPSRRTQSRSRSRSILDEPFVNMSFAPSCFGQLTPSLPAEWPDTQVHPLSVGSKAESKTGERPRLRDFRSRGQPGPRGPQRAAAEQPPHVRDERDSGPLAQGSARRLGGGRKSSAIFLVSILASERQPPHVRDALSTH